MEVNADEPVEGVFSGQNHCDSDDAQAKSDSRSLKDPVEHGIVNNRDDLVCCLFLLFLSTNLPSTF